MRWTTGGSSIVATKRSWPSQAQENIDCENAAQQVGPRHRAPTRRCGRWRWRWRPGGARETRARARAGPRERDSARDGSGAIAGARGQDPVIDEQIDPRLRDQNREFFQELDSIKDERAGAVTPWARERQAHAPVGKQFEALLGERRTAKVVAQAFEPGAIVGADDATGMEIETVIAGVPGRILGRARRIGIDAEAQHAGAGRAAEETPARNRGRRDERGERGRSFAERIASRFRVVVETETVTFEKPRNAPGDHGDEPRELGRGRRRGDNEARAAGAIGREDAVEYERMEMDVQIDRASEAQNRGDGERNGGGGLWICAAHASVPHPSPYRCGSSTP